MLPFYRRYVIAVCASAVVVSIVVSTIWAFVTGRVMASTIEGLLISLAVFFATLAITGRIFNNKATEETERLFALYNDRCDPEAFVNEAADLARAARETRGELSSWVMSYYAQALLDVGKPDAARAILSEQVQSVDALKKTSDQAAVVVNMVPLAMKLEEPPVVMALIDHGIELIGDAEDFASTERRTYLQGQRAIVEARLAGDATQLVELYERIRTSTTGPVRVRVERAWDEAQLYFRAGDVERERTCLQFVADKGNKLALVKPARERLAALASA